LRGLLVAGQLALTLVLANGTALMLQCYGQLSTKDHGFDTKGVLTLQLSLSGPRYAEPEQVRSFYDDVLERVAALPGVRHSAAITRLPLEGGTSSNATIEGREDGFGDAGELPVEVRVTTPAYFQAMGIPLLAGRTLRPGDGPSGLPGVVVNRTMAELCWPGKDPIGKRFGFETLGKVAVVGVVEDVPQWGLEYEPISAAYFPYMAGAPGMFSFDGVRFLVVRADVDPLSLVSAVRRAIWQVDGDQPISDIRSTHDILAGSIARRRFNTQLVSLFASIALVLAGAAVYGAMSHDVAQRIHEIGVRMALGAGRDRVMKLVLMRGLRLAATGVVVGLMGVLASTRLTASMVYGVSALDPLTLVGGIGFLTSIALLGSVLPAYRATRVAPVVALRDE
jgi:putative ABC transport system permease protein